MTSSRGEYITLQEGNSKRKEQSTLTLKDLNIEREKVPALMGEIVDPANDRGLTKAEEVKFKGPERTRNRQQIK